jgi:hypothetical protein
MLGKGKGTKASFKYLKGGLFRLLSSDFRPVEQEMKASGIRIHNH